MYVLKNWCSFFSQMSNSPSSSETGGGSRNLIAEEGVLKKVLILDCINANFASLPKSKLICGFRI